LCMPGGWGEDSDDFEPLLSRGARPPSYAAERYSGFTESGRQESLRHQEEARGELRERKRMQHFTEQVGWCWPLPIACVSTGSKGILQVRHLPETLYRPCPDIARCTPTKAV
jgi:hypothetical protein